MALESNSDRLMSDINVTPFVDVMLVLLIIFVRFYKIIPAASPPPFVKGGRGGFLSVGS